MTKTKEAVLDVIGIIDTHLTAITTRKQREIIQFALEHLARSLDEGWQPIETAPRDGMSILLLTTDGVCEAWFKKGEWEDHYEYGPQYNGAEWVCLDNKFTCEVCETPEGYDDHGVSHWRPLPAPPPSDLLEEFKQRFEKGERS